MAEWMLGVIAVSSVVQTVRIIQMVRHEARERRLLAQRATQFMHMFDFEGEMRAAQDALRRAKQVRRSVGEN